MIHMGNEPGDARAICPYYRRLRRLETHRAEIRCEGATRDMENIVAFIKFAELEKWMNGYCETYEYAKCPYARLIDRNNHTDE